MRRIVRGSIGAEEQHRFDEAPLWCAGIKRVRSDRLNGMLVAVPALWWLNQYVQSHLYDVTPTDPTAILPAAGLLLLAAAVAIWVPSRRALRLNPMTVLRDES